MERDYDFEYIVPSVDFVADYTDLVAEFIHYRERLLGPALQPLYNGSLVVYQGTKATDLSLNAVRMPVLGGKVAMVQLAASLRRAVSLKRGLTIFHVDSSLSLQ